MTESDCKQKHAPSAPNAGAGDPTDGRDPHDWKSKYPSDARKEINQEAAFMTFVAISDLTIIWIVWWGLTPFCLPIDPIANVISFKRYSLYGLSGLLGGTVFSIKYLYRVVARGYWHQDRKLWRLLSPLVALILGVIVGAMFDSNMISNNGGGGLSYTIVIGFLTGYFADHAIAKMYEIAMVIFGTSTTTKTSGPTEKEKGQERTNDNKDNTA